MQAPPEHSVVSLKCAAGSLLIPQALVQGIAPALDAEVGEGGIGEVSMGADRWPLFVLNHDLQPTSQHGDFRFCVCLRDAEGSAFALACDAFDLLTVSEVNVRPLPACMRNDGTPFDSLTRIADEAGLFLNLTALRRHLEKLG
ncbi:MAG: hypothetical protein OET44_15060 [Gammaproteobacteria bacterium]|nr:hypothetical protein [Gammaproteobacteria bacterium]